MTSLTRPPLPDRNYIESLLRAVKHVFETNLVRRTNMEGVLSPDDLRSELANAGENYLISVVVCSGGFDGKVAILTPAGLNFTFARDFLDFDDSMLRLGAEIPIFRDAAGEINNMLAGTFRNILSKGKQEVKLVPPLIVDDRNAFINWFSNAHTGIIAKFSVEEFVIFICLWT